MPEERVDLAPAQEQLAVAVGVVVGHVPLRVLGDVGADEPELAVAHVREGALEGRVPLAQRLDLRPGEDEAGLEAFEQVVVVPSAPVVRDELGPARHVRDWTKNSPSRVSLSSTSPANLRLPPTAYR